MTTPTKHWNFGHTVGIFATLIAVPLFSWLFIWGAHPLLAWFSSFIFIWAFLIIAGHGIIGLWRGMAIDERNVISLSRTQMAIWTVIVLSAYLTGALWNVHVGAENPLAIRIPMEVWGLLGISTVSLVGTPLILSPKKDKEPTPRELKKAAAQLEKEGITHKTYDRTGAVYRNANPSDAEWADIVTGDEVGDAAHLDLSKVQMLFFTVIIAFAYCVAIGYSLIEPGAAGMDHLPEFSTSLLALLGISHGGYLTSKSIPHTVTDQTHK